MADATPRRNLRSEVNDSRSRPITGFRLLVVRLGLFWEQAWPALWPAVALAGVFLAVALFDILPC